MQAELQALREFLTARVYRHARIERIMHEAENVVTDLFAYYRKTPGSLPAEWRAAAAGRQGEAYARHICDYIAGMTDRYALAEHYGLFDRTPDLR